MNNNLPIIFGGNNNPPNHPLLAHFGNINHPINLPAESQAITMQRRQILSDALAQTNANAINGVPMDNIQTNNENSITTISNVAQTVGAVVSHNPLFQGGYTAGGNILLNYVNSGFVYLQQATHLDANPDVYSFRVNVIRGVGYMGVIGLSFMMGYLTGEMPSSSGSLD